MLNAEIGWELAFNSYFHTAAPIILVAYALKLFCCPMLEQAKPGKGEGPSCSQQPGPPRRGVRSGHRRDPEKVGATRQLPAPVGVLPGCTKDGERYDAPRPEPKGPDGENRSSGAELCGGSGFDSSHFCFLIFDEIFRFRDWMPSLIIVIGRLTCNTSNAWRKFGRKTGGPRR